MCKKEAVYEQEYYCISWGGGTCLNAPIGHSEGLSPTESSLCYKLKSGKLFLKSHKDLLIIRQRSSKGWIATILSDFATTKYAFTLAEVLITLGIIGVVAALTIPNLIANHNKSAVEQKLKKFYSMINQAVILAEVQYGDKKYWYQDVNRIETDDEGNPVPGSSVVIKWWNKYLAPNVKTIEIKEDTSGLPTFYFEDGTALKAIQTSYMRDWAFYTMTPEKCEKFPLEGGGFCKFYFIFMPGGDNVSPAYETTPDWKHHINKGFEPYKYYWDGTRNGLFSGSYTGCNETQRVYCAAIIQYEGWKIPDDYPFKVK